VKQPLPRVLCVDDEPKILSAIARNLRGSLDLSLANSGAEALAALRSAEAPFTVLVTDMRMPEMNGVALLTQARREFPDTTRILLTGYADLASIVGSINEGEVWRFINKPWDAKELQRVIAEGVEIATTLPDVPAWRMPAEARFDESILCLDPRDEITPHAVRDFGDTHWVGQARNMDEALRLIQEREVAILVADFDADPAAVKALLHALKVAYPQILTVALTSAADASLLIDLINEVQVYRFLARPVNPLLLKEHVIAALNRYHTYKTSPGLLRAQKVEPERAPPPVSPGFFQRLRNLAGRLPFANNP